MEYSYQIEGGNFSKAGYASSEIKKTLKKLNVPAHIIKKTVVALYETEVNIVAHAIKGTLHVVIDPAKITITAEDEGPGIADVNQAMQEGFSTASKKAQERGFGAGMGLPNIKKNTDEFSIDTLVNQGTTLSLTNYFK